MQPAMLEMRGDEPRVISGYAAVFYNGEQDTQYKMGRTLERIAPTAFQRSLTEEHDIRALYNHDSSSLLGRTGNGTLRLDTDSVGLRYEIDIDANDPDHSRLIPKLRRGDLNGASFGFVIRNSEDSHENGRPVRTITDVDLIEISPTALPAYAATTAQARSADLIAARLRVLDIDDSLYKGQE